MNTFTKTLAITTCATLALGSRVSQATNETLKVWALETGTTSTSAQVMTLTELADALDNYNVAPLTQFGWDDFIDSVAGSEVHVACEARY